MEWNYNWPHIKVGVCFLFKLLTIKTLLEMELEGIIRFAIVFRSDGYSITFFIATSLVLVIIKTMLELELKYFITGNCKLAMVLERVNY